ncbi:MAG: amino acid permease [Proteobacteria bacterium]|nr:amino acid permease [Pseudomonadota bacterium]
MKTKDTQLDRSISLLGAIALVVGGVIGMGIYALIAKVTANVGTTIWMPFLLAMLVMLFGIVPFIQITATLPRAGAAYVYTSRLLHPLLGTVVSWLAIFSVACTSVFISIGMAGYLVPYLPFKISIGLLSVIIPLLFLVLYLFSFRLANIVQVALTAVLVVALMIYGIVGSFSLDLTFTTSLPKGSGGLIMASIICYTAWFGFGILAEIGEEIRNAKRNITLAIIVGAVVILVVYIVVGTVFANAVPYDYEAIGSMTAPLKTTGEQFLPPFFVGLLAFGAIAAGVTSFNASAIAMPREIFAQSRDGLLPQALTRVSAKTKSPNNAVIAYFLMVFVILIIGLALELEIDFYAVLSAQGVLALTVLVSIASLRLSKKLPQYYAKAYFQTPRPLLWILVVLAVVSSLGFFFLMLMEMPVSGLTTAAVAALAAVFHVVRVSALKKQGVDWADRISKIPGYDEE